MHGNPGATWCNLTLQYKGMEPITTAGWLTAEALKAAMGIASENRALDVTPCTPPEEASKVSPIQTPNFALLGLPFLAAVNLFHEQEQTPGSRGGSGESETVNVQPILAPSGAQDQQADSSTPNVAGQATAVKQEPGAQQDNTTPAPAAAVLNADSATIARLIEAVQLATAAATEAALAAATANNSIAAMDAARHRDREEFRTELQAAVAAGITAPPSPTPTIPGTPSGAAPAAIDVAAAPNEDVAANQPWPVGKHTSHSLHNYPDLGFDWESADLGVSREKQRATQRRIAYLLQQVHAHPHLAGTHATTVPPGMNPDRMNEIQDLGLTQWAEAGWLLDRALARFRKEDRHTRRMHAGKAQQGAVPPLGIPSLLVSLVNTGIPHKLAVSPCRMPHQV